MTTGAADHDEGDPGMGVVGVPPVGETPGGRETSALELVGLRRSGSAPRSRWMGWTWPCRRVVLRPGGPNGAGKTTSLSIGVGLLRPDEGTARIFGGDVWADPTAAKELVGVLPDGLAMPERLTDREVLSYLGLLRGLDQATVASAPTGCSRSWS